MSTQTIQFISDPECDAVSLYSVTTGELIAEATSVVMGDEEDPTSDTTRGTCIVEDVPAGLYKVISYEGEWPIGYEFVDLLDEDGVFPCRDSIHGDARISSRAVPGSEMALEDDAITASKYDETTAYPIKSADSGSTAIARTGGAGDTLETIGDQLETAQDDLDRITGSDGAILATSQPNYAPAKAGDEMDLVDAPNALAITAIQEGLSKFDPAEDAVARVTLVDTCTANTDMRGTNNAVTSLSGMATSTQVAAVGTKVDNLTIPTKEAIAGQVRTELATELGRVDVTVSSRLAPTTAGRTLNVEADGTIITTTEVSEDSIREAMGLQEGQRVATPGDLSVTVAPVEADAVPRIRGTNIVTYLGSTAPITINNVKDSFGTLIDLDSIGDLRLVIRARKNNVQLQVVDQEDLTISGDSNQNVTFTPDSGVTEKVTSSNHPLAWSLLRVSLGSDPIALGNIIVEYCAQPDQTP